MTVLNVTEATFEKEVLRSEIPVLVDFYADWCQPCKVQSPIVEQVAKELEGKVKVVKIDSDKNRRLAQAFQVQSIPMLFVVQNGEVAGVWDQGVADKKTILRLLQPVLPRSANELKPNELAALLKERRVLPVDVRDEAAFQRYRIPGAINIPASQLETRAAELVPRDGRVRVLYSRANDEAKDLAEKLMKQGHQVGFLAGGFLHWEADGLEVERGRPS
jgi:thioredoxin 1/putative thioredoxin